MLPSIQSFVVVAVLAVPLILVWRWPKAQTLHLPPGPKSSWTGGVDIPKLYPWRTYTQWKDEYGTSLMIICYTSTDGLLRRRRVYLRVYEQHYYLELY